MDLAHLCFEGPLEELVETEVQQPTLVTTSLAILAAVRGAGSGPTSSSAIPWASSPRSRPWARCRTVTR